MKLAISQRAETQLQAIHDYIAADSPRAASKVVGDIRAAAKLLSEFPLIGHAGSDAGTREWVVRGRPYVITYEVDEHRDTLTVLTVVHGARDRTR